MLSDVIAGVASGSARARRENWNESKKRKTLAMQASDVIDCKMVRIFGVFKYGRAVKQKVWNVFFLLHHTPYGRARLARLTHVRLLRHALPISLLILTKNPTVLQSSDVTAKDYSNL